MIPRREACRIGTEQLPSPEDGLLPTPGPRPALGRPSRRLPSRARVFAPPPKSHDEAVGPPGIESHHSGAKVSGALIRPRLGASQLSGIGARLAGTEVVPEPAEPFPLIGIGPDHRIFPARDASGVDVALPDPFLESAVCHAELVRQAESWMSVTFLSIGIPLQWCTSSGPIEAVIMNVTRGGRGRIGAATPG
jgi:hypothetical protein